MEGECDGAEAEMEKEASTWSQALDGPSADSGTLRSGSVLPHKSFFRGPLRA